MATNVIQLPKDAGATLGSPAVGGTAGSVLFIDASGNVNQDNPNFYWDDTNKRLGIGVNTSLLSKVHIQPGSTTEKGIVIRGAAGQTANLQEWQDSSSAVFMSIGTVQATNPYVNIFALNTTHVPLKIWGYLTNGTYNTDLVQWRDKDGRVGKINYRGALILPGAASTLSGQELDFSCLAFAGISGMRFSGTDGSNNNILAASGQSIGIAISDVSTYSVIIRTETRRLHVTSFGWSGDHSRDLSFYGHTSPFSGEKVQVSIRTNWLDNTDGSQRSVFYLNLVGGTTLLEAFKCEAPTTSTTRTTIQRACLTGTASGLTIASGVVTATKSYHTIDTEGGAASDDLDTINGGSEGDFLIVRAANSARTVVAKDATGNLQLNGDFTMDNAQDTLTLIYDGSNWLEVSRSDNGA